MRYFINTIALAPMLALIGIASGCFGRADLEDHSTGIHSRREVIDEWLDHKGKTDKHWGRVLADMRQAGEHRWAGYYYWGDGLGANVTLVLAPNEGFVYQWSGCLGVYAENRGAIVEEGGVLELRPEVMEGDNFRLPRNLRLVKWGERRYLIDPNRIIAFCNEINSGREPRSGPYGSYFLDKPEAPAKGEPDIPRDFLGFILKQPLNPRVVAVTNVTEAPDMEDWTKRITHVTLDMGRLDGVFVGMSLHLPDYRTLNDIEVTAVEDRSCQAVVIQRGSKLGRKLKPGDGLSTRALRAIPLGR